MPTQKFDFETYVREQFGAFGAQLQGIAAKLESLDTRYIPREENNLRLAEITKAQAALAQTLADHTKMLTALKTTDDRQQGNIDTSRRFLSYGFTLAGLFMTGLFIYVSWKVGTAKL